MEIKLFRVENLKKVKFLEIKPTDNVIVIAGNNGAGKTSALDAMSWGLLGGESIDAVKPIREGETEAKVLIELDDLIVKRVWKDNKDKNGVLTVTNKDGIKYPSPQNLLKGFVGKFSFDPLEFSRLKEKEQKELLLDLLNIKDKLNELEEKKETAYQERTIINRNIRTIEAQLEEIGVPELDIPDKEINVTQLREQLEKGLENNSDISVKGNEIKLCKGRIAELEKKLEDEKETLKGLAKELEDLGSETDIEPIRNKIDEAEKINEKVRIKIKYDEKKYDLKEADSLSKEKTRIIEEVEREKLRLLKETSKPVKGLDIEEDYIAYNSIPFVQLSSSEKLKVSLKIAMATNPNLRTIRITDGSLLDDESMDYIDKIAREEKYQIWIERVSVDKYADIVMVDGEGSLKK